MNKQLREDIIEKYDESKYGELKIHDVVSYESLSSPKLYKFKKSNSDSNIYEYFNKKYKKRFYSIHSSKKINITIILYIKFKI